MRNDALRVYVAGVVATALTFLCHLTNHVGGCWLCHSRLYFWADQITSFPPDGYERHDPSQPFPKQRLQFEVVEQGAGYMVGRLSPTPPAASHE
jgi:hypothetical protein